MILELNAIQNTFPFDRGLCCRNMFNLWLQTQPKASWNQLIHSLRKRNVRLYGLAYKVEKRLSKSTGAYVHIN